MRTLLFISIFVILSSCASKTSRYANTSGYGGADYDELSEGVHSDKNKHETKATRKVLYSADINLTVKQVDTTIAQLTAIATKHKGYVNQAGTYQTIIRVKSDAFKNALEEITSLGKVKSKNIQGQDVTDTYLDYQIRLDNAVKARSRYLELLAKAENVEAALKVEKELERLNGAIELFKGRMNRINHLSEFSTITIRLKEKRKPGVLGYIGLGIYHSVRWLFVRG